MAPNPLRAAHRQADRDNRELATLFGRYLGTARHPRGQVLVAYRTTRRALSDILQAPARTGGTRALAATLSETNDILTNHQRQLRTIALEAAVQARKLGETSAQAQATAYADSGHTFEPAQAPANLRPILDGMDATANAQLTQAQALIAAGADTSLIIGDEGRLGIVQAAPITRDWATWLAVGSSLGFWSWLVGNDPTRLEPFQFQRQAVAAIDERTTDCCLQVHGQIVGLRSDFKLTGTPRFADRMRDPPFHWYCRTSVALYLQSYDEGLTDRMRSAARAELTARADGSRVEIHPSHATSRR